MTWREDSNVKAAEQDLRDIVSMDRDEILEFGVERWRAKFGQALDNFADAVAACSPESAGAPVAWMIVRDIDGERTHIAFVEPVQHRGFTVFPLYRGAPGAVASPTQELRRLTDEEMEDVQACADQHEQVIAQMVSEGKAAEIAKWYRTERTMHNAWRKRAEEAEAALAAPQPAVTPEKKP